MAELLKREAFNYLTTLKLTLSKKRAEPIYAAN